MYIGLSTENVRKYPAYYVKTLHYGAGSRGSCILGDARSPTCGQLCCSTHQACATQRAMNERVYSFIVCVWHKIPQLLCT